MTTRVHEADWNGQYNGAPDLEAVMPTAEVSRALGGTATVLAWQAYQRDAEGRFPADIPGVELLG